MSLLDTIYAGVGGSNDPYAGDTYRLVDNNDLVAVLQTPTLWGTQPNSTAYYTGPAPAGQNLVDAIGTLIRSASSVVDIATLAPFPDGQFLAAIKSALLDRARNNVPLLVRVHAGFHPAALETYSGASAVANLLAALTDDLPANAPLTVAVSGALFSLVKKSWNHGKVVAVDGREVIFGGHNLWAADYLGYAPVHDLSLQVRGTAAEAAHVFCDHLWDFVGKWYSSINPATRVWSQVWQQGQVTSGVPRKRPSSVAPGATGTLRAMPVARMGYGVVPPVPSGTDQVSNLAKVEAFKAATTSIRLSQQDLAFSIRGAVSDWLTFADEVDEQVIAALGGALDRGVDVFVVLSGRHAKSGGGNPYANLGGAATRQLLVEWFRAVDQMTGPRLAAMLSHLHMRELHTVAGNFDPWKQGLDERVQANHAKCYIIDDQVAYVGSDNLYKCELAEFGMLIEDPAALQQLLTSYWGPLWNNAHPVVAS
ncbi:MAG TPA: hypothetical protein DCR14_04130 [Acidimicrobiaceae bacterium]|nr:hypothetical protein [Acidimicrobiaceae bacterium]